MKENKSLRLSLLPVLLVLSLTRCQAPASSETTEPEVAPNRVSLTETQFVAAAINLGKISRKPIGSSLSVNGVLDVPPQNLITIAAPMGGFVKSTHLLQGMKVKKGEVLVTLQHQDYIQLQQDYLETQSRLEYSEKEYTRQQELARENINSGKALQQAKSEYQTLKAKASGLEARLTLINITPSSLADGKIHPTINLYSQLSGYVTQVNVNLGQYVNTADVMFKIVDIEHLHAELQVYERDIHLVQIGQPVLFQLANETRQRRASVYLVGKEISEDRTVRIHCHLDEEDPGLLPGMYVSAQIQTASHEADVLPPKAIVEFLGDHYIFVSLDGKRQFEMVKVKTGATSEDAVEIILPPDFNRDADIVVNGAFSLLGVLKNQEDEE